MDPKRVCDARRLAHITLKEHIEWDEDKIGSTSPFDKNTPVVTLSPPLVTNPPAGPGAAPTMASRVHIVPA